MPVPTVHRGQLFIELKSDWSIDDTTYAAGSLLTSELDAFLAGERKLERLFEPTPQSSLAGFAPTRNHVLVNVLDNVRNRVYHRDPGHRRLDAAATVRQRRLPHGERQPGRPRP